MRNVLINRISQRLVGTQRPPTDILLEGYVSVRVYAYRHKYLQKPEWPASQEVASNIDGASFKICLKHRKYKCSAITTSSCPRHRHRPARVRQEYGSGSGSGSGCLSGATHTICMRQEIRTAGTVASRPVSSVSVRLLTSPPPASRLAPLHLSDCHLHVSVRLRLPLSEHPESEIRIPPPSLSGRPGALTPEFLAVKLKVYPNFRAQISGTV